MDLIDPPVRFDKIRLSGCMIFPMRRGLPLLLLAITAGAQPPSTASFEVASIKSNQHLVGPDYNNHIAISPSGFTAHNATLRRLIAEAYALQLRQISGPDWLDQNEYEIEARTSAASERAAVALMLRSLLSERFHLKQHRETREMRVYVLVVAPSGAKIHPATAPEAPGRAGGFHFRGDMRRFADFLAVQFSIPAAVNPAEPVRAGGPMLPVLDRTGLQGDYDFTADIRPEMGVDSFTLWKRALREQLGLNLESRREPVEILVIDEAAKTPAAN